MDSSCLTGVASVLHAQTATGTPVLSAKVGSVKTVDVRPMLETNGHNASMWCCVGRYTHNAHL